MSNTYRHVEHAKLRKEYKASPKDRWHPSIENQEMPEIHPKHASDLRFACHCYECLAVLRGATGGSKLRRIRHGERRAIRMALVTGKNIDLTRRIPVGYHS